MYDICCIGHITSDKIVTPGSVVHMPGGTAFYFSKAISRLRCHYLLATLLAEAEMAFAEELRVDSEVLVLPSRATVCFENIYPENQDHRIQKVTCQADPFQAAQLQAVDAQVFHLGPLLAGDIPVEMIKDIALRGKVSLDVQGYLREVRGTDVHAIDWADKKEALSHIHFLKANESEAEVLTGHSDIYQSAALLAEWGVKEVIITLGSMGSLIYHENKFYQVPAYPPSAVVDATGCGDTYMAGYLYQRLNGRSCQEAGAFAAAMATIKIQSSGPFTGTKEAVLQLLHKHSFPIAEL